ncbi:MAG: hypothetical protein WD003_01265 [Candidatus Paceibacterota bacterium]
MKKQDYFLYSGIVFVIAALLHATRIFNEWALTLGPWDVPLWLSWVAVVIAIFLAYHAFQLK